MPHPERPERGSGGFIRNLARSKTCICRIRGPRDCRRPGVARCMSGIVQAKGAARHIVNLALTLALGGCSSSLGAGLENRACSADGRCLAGYVCTADDVCVRASSSRDDAMRSQTDADAPDAAGETRTSEGKGVIVDGGARDANASETAGHDRNPPSPDASSAEPQAGAGGSAAGGGGTGASTAGPNAGAGGRVPAPPAEGVAGSATVPLPVAGSAGSVPVPAPVAGAAGSATVPAPTAGAAGSTKPTAGAGGSSAPPPAAGTGAAAGKAAPPPAAGAPAPTCAEDRMLCSGHCVNLKNDANNCGRCGNTCDDGQQCKQGECRDGGKDN
jgi:hypothetical protein